MIGSVLAAALALPACSSTDPATTASASASPSLMSRLTGGLWSSSNERAVATVAGNPSAEEIDCPGVEIRPGASTLMIAAKVREPTANDLRYQVSFARFARECAVTGATMTVKVGIQGRVVLGPAGGPGKLDVPVRYAVVQEGPEPKTIITKFQRFPVTVGAGETHVLFTHVQDDLTFPMPSLSTLAAYVIYVGFDEQGKPDRPQPQRRRPPPKRAS